MGLFKSHHVALHKHILHLSVNLIDEKYCEMHEKRTLESTGFLSWRLLLFFPFSGVSFINFSIVFFTIIHGPVLVGLCVCLSVDTSYSSSQITSRLATEDQRDHN